MPLSPSAKKQAASTLGKVRVVQDPTQSAGDAKVQPTLSPVKRDPATLRIPAPAPAVQPKPKASSKPRPAQAQTTPARSQKSSTPPTRSTQKPKAIAKKQSPASPNDLVVNLAQLPNTEPCLQVEGQQLEGCWKSQQSQWRSVYAKVHEQITAQGYNVRELELEDDTGFKVSQISQNGTTKYYLHLLSTLSGTVYVLNPTQLSKDEIEQRINST
ncbi:MAG: hypothetical protein NW224_18655 [Leptolyngbyaceae cyanobacterium bins.302]|nr:hypothetical protein [Leptolyngbyaceae cyanobacterium bins.302]